MMAENENTNRFIRPFVSNLHRTVKPLVLSRYDSIIRQLDYFLRIDSWKYRTLKKIDRDFLLYLCALSSFYNVVLSPLNGTGNNSVEEMCKKIAIINKGKIVSEGTINEIRKKMKFPDVIHVYLSKYF